MSTNTVSSTALEFLHGFIASKAVNTLIVDMTLETASVSRYNTFQMSWHQTDGVCDSNRNQKARSYATCLLIVCTTYNQTIFPTDIWRKVHIPVQQLGATSLMLPWNCTHKALHHLGFLLLFTFLTKVSRRQPGNSKPSYT